MRYTVVLFGVVLFGVAILAISGALAVQSGQPMGPIVLFISLVGFFYLLAAAWLWPADDRC